MIKNTALSSSKICATIKNGMFRISVRPGSGYVSDQTHRKPITYPIVNKGPNKHLPFKVCTIDDMPVPQGDWYEDYRKRCAGYNKVLVFGFLFMMCPVFYHFYYQPIFYNALIPPLPPKEERIKSFWVPADMDEEDDD